jgi:tetratricopeptide (TPR) repeat protein
MTFFCSIIAHAQIQRCGTPTPAQTVPENSAFRRQAGTIVSVPVVFHVVYYNNGVGNVPESQLRAQLDTLNAAHTRAGSQFSFYLAAITRTPKDQWCNISRGSQAEREMTDTLAIDPKHAFNIYVTDLGQSYLGWVINWPWSVPEDSRQNGVVIHYGSLPGGYIPYYNYGYTLVHEGGHYLGLYHTFQNGCTSPGDEVDDTPYEAYPASGCPSPNPDTCPQSGLDPIHNYMDYSTDPCMYEFTYGQDNRSSSITGQYRPNLGGTTLYFSSTYTVLAGRSLNFQPGITLAFQNGVSLIVNGTLNANGTSSSRITFTSASGTTFGSWGSIVLSGSGASGSILDYVTMQYGGQISVLSAQNVTIQHSSIQNCINGIYGYYASGSILQNTITNVRDHGINLIVAPFTCNQNVIKKTSDFGNYQSGGGIICQSGSSGNLWQNDIAGYNWGIGAIWGSSPQFRSASNNWKNNRIKYCLTGVEVYQQSYPTICYYPGAPYWTYYTGNSISSNTYYNVFFTSGGTLFAEFTYWGGTPTPSMFYLGSGCSIDYNNWLTNDPWNPPPAPSYSGAPLGQLSTRQDIVQSNPDESLFDGINLRMNGKHKEAKDFFLSYIATNPNDQAAYVELYNCYNDETAKDIIDFFTSLPKAAAKEHELLLSYLYVKQNNVKLAEQVNSKVISENPNTPLAAKAKLNNFYIALYNENDVVGASAILNEVLHKAELSTPMELSIAQDALEAYGKGGFGQPGKQSVSVSLVQSGLSQNYPDPFNPLTTIAYRLTRPGKVSLKVFDVLGREVATLVNGEQMEGIYTEKFDASHLSSGIYFYQLLAPGVNETRKMLIAK